MKGRPGIVGALIAAGLMLIAWGLLMPREGRLVREPLPLDTHVTAFGPGAGGTLLAATQSGGVWRLGAEGWRAERIPGLGGRLVLALSGEPSERTIGTSAGILSPAGVEGPPGAPRVADLLQRDTGLMVAAADGVWVHGATGWHQVVPGVQAYRLIARSRPGVDDIHVGTIGDGLFSTSAQDLLGGWTRNDLGLPRGAKALSFAVAEGGTLLLGTDRGLYWQRPDGGPWAAVAEIPRTWRTLAMTFDPVVDSGVQRLWLGGDTGLYGLDLEERPGALVVAGPPHAIRAPAEPLPSGVSQILPFGGTLMLSAGAIYRLAWVRRPGWYRFVLVGLTLAIAGIGYGVRVGRRSTPTPDRLI